MAVATGPGAMHGFVETFRDIWNRLNSIALASCGSCGATGGGLAAKERGRLEPALARLFLLRPLSGGDAEAVRATQRAARWSHEGRTEDCLRELHDAKRFAPRDHVPRTNLAAFYFERGDEDAALHWSREAHRIAPHDDVASLATALLEQRAGNVSEAQWLLANFLQEVDSGHPGALRQLARVHQQQGQWAQAASCYRRLMSAEPGNPEWDRELHYCLERAPCSGGAAYPPVGDYSQARSDDRAGGGAGGFDADGRSPGVGGGRGRAFASRGGAEARPPVGGGLREAARLFETGRTEAALAAYRSVLRGSPDNAEALGGLADCLGQLGQVDSAIEAGKQLLGLTPDDPEANLRMAELLLDAGRPAYHAEPYLQRAHQAQPADRIVRRRLFCATAEAALATEDYKKAVSSAAAAVREDANEPKALILLADARIRVAEYEAALRALSSAQDALANRQGPEAVRRLAVTHTLRAQAQERLRQYPKALEEAQRALELDPHLAAARVVRATAMQQSGRDYDAQMELQQVLSKDPDHVAAKLQLGYLQLSANDFRAVGTLEAVVNNPSASRSTLGAAKVYLALALRAEDRTGMPNPSRRDRAEQVLKEGISLHKNLQVIWREELEQSLPRGERPVAAVQRLRGICDLDLTAIQAKQLLQLLVQTLGRPEHLRGASISGMATPVDTGGYEGSRASSVSMPPNRRSNLGAGDSAAPSASNTPLQRLRGGTPTEAVFAQPTRDRRTSVPATPGSSPWLGETRTLPPSRGGDATSPQGLRNLPAAPPPSWALNGLPSSLQGQPQAGGPPSSRGACGAPPYSASSPYPGARGLGNAAQRLRSPGAPPPAGRPPQWQGGGALGQTSAVPHLAGARTPMW